MLPIIMDKVDQLFAEFTKKQEERFSSLENNLRGTLFHLTNELNELQKDTTNSINLINTDISDMKKTLTAHDKRLTDISTSILRSAEATTKATTSTANINDNGKTLYMTSIEADLTLEEIRLILQDYDVILAGILLQEVKGNFTTKKYIKVSAQDPKCLSKLKISFNSSKVSSSWYLRDRPPLSPEQRANNNKNKQQYPAPPAAFKNVHRNVSDLPKYNQQPPRISYSNRSSQPGTTANEEVRPSRPPKDHFVSASSTDDRDQQLHPNQQIHLSQHPKNYSTSGNFTDFIRMMKLMKELLV